MVKALWSLFIVVMIPVFDTLTVTISEEEFIAHVSLNRPDHMNACNDKLFTELGECFKWLGASENVRVVILDGGVSKHFTAGLDLSDLGWLMNATSDQSNDLARKAKVLRQVVDRWQAAVSSIEECCKPVIVCVHGGCIGAGVDIITACDIRLCDSEAFCSIKEVDIGLAADLGTLQRLTKVIGSQSVVRELCYRANSISSKEMLGIGLVSGTYDNRDRMKEHALKLAKEISVKSPVAVQMTKRALVHALNNPTNSSLDYIANYNMFLLQSQDLMESISAKIEKRKPVYSKL